MPVVTRPYGQERANGQERHNANQQCFQSLRRMPPCDQRDVMLSARNPAGHGRDRAREAPVEQAEVGIEGMGARHDHALRFRQAGDLDHGVHDPLV
jgi:hypothetical protein